MKKTLLSFTLILFCCAVASAQFTGGIKGGLNLATLGGDADGAKMRPSIHLGGYINYPMSDVLSFQPELLFTSVGAKFKESESTDDGFGNTIDISYKNTTILNYISFPLMFKYKAGTVNLEAGPQLGFFMGGKAKQKMTATYMGETMSESESTDIDEGVNALDLGLNLGLSMDFDKLTAGLRYSAGLANVNDEGSDKITNNVLQLSVSYRLFEK
jgi:hypothetical protein